MAFQKSKSVKGFSANYWRIIQININFDRRDVLVTIVLHKDEATRNADEESAVDGFTVLLGAAFLNRTPTNDGTVKMRRIMLDAAYAAVTNLAIAEAAKPIEKQDADLAFLAGAIEV